ncbi:MAG: peptidoglycan bridge formation glycyltransferase FemA/FemB family protein [Erysipelotrichales bacterium]|nr:peptidoglycan bridge formation glycyltransferase FemA/FemB family protein [Erysipelotrichales bacterium]
MYTWKVMDRCIEFDTFIDQHPLSSATQLSAWGEVKSEWESLYPVVVDESGAIVAAGLLLKRTVIAGFTLGYMPRGPILDFDNEEVCNVFFTNLKKLAKREKMISIKIDPNIYQVYEIHQREEAQSYRNDAFVEKLAKYGFKHHGYTMDMYDTTQARFQVTFPLSENNFERFPKKTRDKIKQATNYHIEIEEKHSESVDAFYEIISYTERRKGIILRNASYFKKILDAFKEDSVLLFAYLNVGLLKQDLLDRMQELEHKLAALDEKAVNKREVAEKQLAKARREYEQIAEESESRIPVSALLLAADGKTTELLYSGLNEKYRRFLAPYALRNAGIEWSYRHGKEYFNFGGVQGSLEDGLFEFKSSFHPDIRAFVGEFDIPVYTLLSFALDKAIHIKKRIQLAMAKKG